MVNPKNKITVPDPASNTAGEPGPAHSSRENPRIYRLAMTHYGHALVHGTVGAGNDSDRIIFHWV
jgi:hypothetical protein